MLVSERQRAYRYGMTLLCVGAFFNWLGLTEGHSDPVRFIGFTCLASGGLLVCLAICFWANSSSSSQRRRGGDDVVVNISDFQVRSNSLEEKPPDYEAVTSPVPPPTYDEAIKLSPLFLPCSSEESESPRTERPPNASRQASVSTEPEPSTSKTPTDGESSLTRVFRISKNLLLRRTVSNADSTQLDVPRIPVPRSSSFQELGPTEKI